MVRAVGLDHLVLCVADAEASFTWYNEMLGLEPERLEEWRRGEVPFVSVRVDEATIIDLLQTEPTGVNVDHVCMVVDGDVDLDEVASSGRFDVVAPPRRLWGARGWGTGMYVRDPDGHVIELRQYPASQDAG